MADFKPVSDRQFKDAQRNADANTGNFTSESVNRKPQHVTSHEHYFSTPDYMQPDDCTDDITGRYDVYETRDDKTGVWSPKTDNNWPTKNFAEARRMAKALCDEYAALNQ